MVSARKARCRRVGGSVSCARWPSTKVRHSLGASRKRSSWRRSWTTSLRTARRSCCAASPASASRGCCSRPRAAARERGMSVLTTTGVQSETHLPFAGLHQLLPTGARAREQSSARSIERRSTPLSASRLSRALSPSGSRWRARPRFRKWPLMLRSCVIVDDAHWLDRPSADVLAFLARRIESDPILLLAALRDGYGSVLAKQGCPNTSSSASTMRLQQRCSTRLRRSCLPPHGYRVLREAAGNPLALVELSSAAVVRGGRAVGDRAALR